MFDQIDFRSGTMRATNLSVLGTVLPIFQCPSTPGFPRTVPLANENSVSPKPDSSSSNPGTKTLPRSPSHRVGVFDYGIPRQHVFLSNWDTEQREPAWHGVKLGARKPDRPCLGLLRFGPARMKWVTDGLSKTTAFYEQAWRPNAVRRAGLDGLYDLAGNPLDGRKHLFDVGFSWAQPYGTEQAVSQGINQTNGFGGRFAFHSGGVNNVSLDTTVRFLSEDIDSQVLKAVDSRAGAESVRL